MSANISCKEAAAELLRQCVAGEPPDEALIRASATATCTVALFRILVEGLADRFETRLCDAYARILTRVIELNTPEFRAADLLARYQRIRTVRSWEPAGSHDPESVVVLSRVTLGADIAVTSVILDGVKRRFPRAAIYLAGSRAAAELFQADPRVGHLNIQYPRGGSVADRIACCRELTGTIPNGALVIDPDSRLTQLGLLPVVDDRNYLFFESRAYGGDRDIALAQLAAEWVQATLGVERCNSYLALTPSAIPVRHPCAAVSLGVGGNEAKRLSPGFEQHLIHRLSGRFTQVIVDRGAGPDESARAEHAVAGTTAELFGGSFAEFAAVIARSDAYIGYDSAGQHAAAALSIPLVTLFKGFVTDRMFQRWQPTGPGLKQVTKIDDETTESAVMASLEASFFRTA